MIEGGKPYPIPDTPSTTANLSNGHTFVTTANYAPQKDFFDPVNSNLC
jgi:hypothetical protein